MSPRFESRCASFAYPEPADLRKGYNGLYHLVKTGLGRDPLCGALFLFTNGRRSSCKGLLWDGTGLRTVAASIISCRCGRPLSGLCPRNWDRLEGRACAGPSSARLEQSVLVAGDRVQVHGLLTWRGYRSFYCGVKLTQPELRTLVKTTGERLRGRLSLATRVRRRLGVRLPVDDENSRLAVLSQLEAQGLLEIGRFTYGTPTILTFGPNPPSIRIGAYCSIADGVEILLNGNHRTDWVSTYPFRIQLQMQGMFDDGHPVSRGPITIGNDVWLARGALILSGVNIGDGAVVAARAVVTRDVAPYSIVAGNPARHTRYRFDQDVIEALVRLGWWDWPESKIRASVPDLCGGNVRSFLRQHGALPPSSAPSHALESKE